MSINLNIGSEDRKKVAVISHERSGTHFLMNTMALNFGYLSNPWWNFDFELGINFHSPSTILQYIQLAHDKPILNILKSHHPIGIYADIMEYMSSQFFILYIHRDPAATLRSNRRLIESFRLKGWDEGPLSQNLSEFLRLEPSGSMLRYQKMQEASMVHRWHSHVSGWLDYESIYPDRIHTISYRDLNDSFVETVKKLSADLDLRLPVEIRRPERDKNVISSNATYDEQNEENISASDLDFIREVAGPLLDRLGYNNY